MGRRGRKRCDTTTQCCGCVPQFVSWAVTEQPAEYTTVEGFEAIRLTGVGAAAVTTNPTGEYLFRPDEFGRMQTGRLFEISWTIGSNVIASVFGSGNIYRFPETSFELDLYCNAAGNEKAATVRVTLHVGGPFGVTQYQAPPLHYLNWQFASYTSPITYEEFWYTVELLDKDGQVVDSATFVNFLDSYLDGVSGVGRIASQFLGGGITAAVREAEDGTKTLDVFVSVGEDLPHIFDALVLDETLAIDGDHLRLHARATNVTTPLVLQAFNTISRPPSVACLPDDVAPYCDPEEEGYVAETVSFPWAKNFGPNASRCTHWVKNSRVTHALCSLDPQAIALSIDPGPNDFPIWQMISGNYELALQRGEAGAEVLADNTFWLDANKSVSMSGPDLGFQSNASYSLTGLTLAASVRTRTRVGARELAQFAEWRRPCDTDAATRWPVWLVVHILAYMTYSDSDPEPGYSGPLSVYTRLNLPIESSMSFLRGESCPAHIPQDNELWHYAIWYASDFVTGNPGFQNFPVGPSNPISSIPSFDPGQSTIRLIE